MDTDCAEQAEMPKNIPFCKRVRTNEEVVCDLSHERRDVSWNLEKLKNAINANPDSVSEKHKELWKKQAAAMEEYKRILGERIKDLIGE